jgi:hypothetical protein
MRESQRFRTIIEQARGPGAAVALVPTEVATALGGLKQMRVVGTLNGVAFRSSTFPWHARELYLGLHKATRQAAGVGVGDEVDIEIRRDDSPRVVEIAPELAAAFEVEPELRTRFDRLSFSRQRLLADPVVEARRPETRAARVERAMTRLRELG